MPTVNFFALESKHRTARWMLSDPISEVHLFASLREAGRGNQQAFSENQGRKIAEGFDMDLRVRSERDAR